MLFSCQRYEKERKKSMFRKIEKEEKKIILDIDKLIQNRVILGIIYIYIFFKDRKTNIMKEGEGKYTFFFLREKEESIKHLIAANIFRES